MTPATYPQLADIARELLPGLGPEQLEALVRAGARARETAAQFRTRCHRTAAQQRANKQKHGSALANKYAEEWRKGVGGWNLAR